MSTSISVLRGQGRAQRGRRPLDMLGLFLRVSSNAKRVHVSLLHSQTVVGNIGALLLRFLYLKRASRSLAKTG